MTDIEARVLRLYQARQAAAEAKKIRSELAERIGACSEAEEYYACYTSSWPKDRWCEICKAKLPIWNDYRRKVAASGAALRSVLRAGKELSKNQTA